MTDLVRALAAVILHGDYRSEAIAERIRQAQLENQSGSARSRKASTRWIPAFVDRLLATFPDDRLPPLRRQLVSFLNTEAALPETVRSRFPSLLRKIETFRSEFRPFRDAFRDWNLPAIETPGELANWLNIPSGQLDWLANRYRHSRSAPRLHVRVIRSRSGKARILEIPCPPLRYVQQRIHREILARIPVHEAACGFVPHRSLIDAAKRHVGRAVLWKTDVANFFLSIAGNRVRGVFRVAGYPEEVADLLMHLTTSALTSTDLSKLAELSRDDQFAWRTRGRLLHLPQGAPTSPALSNLVSFQLDSRLQGLANCFGASYSRYADDLTFSGDRLFSRSLPRFQEWATAILIDEGFEIRARKSCVMTASRRQTVCGIVVNERVNPDRREYKKLHAILHNCVVHGPASQNREEHPDFAASLRGQINWIHQLNARRGRKLQEIYDRINW